MIKEDYSSVQKATSIKTLNVHLTLLLIDYNLFLV